MDAMRPIGRLPPVKASPNGQQIAAKPLTAPHELGALRLGPKPLPWVTEDPKPSPDARTSASIISLARKDASHSEHNIDVSSLPGSIKDDDTSEDDSRNGRSVSSQSRSKNSRGRISTIGSPLMEESRLRPISDEPDTTSPATVHSPSVPEVNTDAAPALDRIRSNKLDLKGPTKKIEEAVSVMVPAEPRKTSTRPHKESKVEKVGVRSSLGEGSLTTLYKNMQLNEQDSDDHEVLHDEVLEALFRHARQSIYKKVIEFFDQNPTVNVDVRDEHLNTVLIIAASQNCKRLVKVCLRRGSNPNAQNKQGNSAAHQAFRFKYVELAYYLLEKGTDPTLKNAEGVQLLQLCQQYPKPAPSGAGQDD